MLVLTRRVDEALLIQDNIIVTVLAIEGDKVKLGIQAPRHIPVVRQELCEAVRRQNIAAAGAGEVERQGVEVVRKLLAGAGGPLAPRSQEEAGKEPEK